MVGVITPNRCNEYCQILCGTVRLSEAGLPLPDDGSVFLAGARQRGEQTS